MDHYQCIQMKDSEDAAILKRFVEKERIFEFLAGLNLEFDQVQVQVLGKEDLPSLNETISIIWAEEGRRGVMMNQTPMVESSAMLSNAGNMKNVVAENQLNAANKWPDSFRWCNYYKKPGHTKDMCWKLHGRTPNFNNDIIIGAGDLTVDSNKKFKDRQILPIAIHQTMRMRPQ